MVAHFLAGVSDNFGHVINRLQSVGLGMLTHFWLLFSKLLKLFNLFVKQVLVLGYSLLHFALVKSKLLDFSHQAIAVFSIFNLMAFLLGFELDNFF